MIAEYFTKLLQEKYFNIFCDFIMGYSHVDTLLTEDLSIKERIEKVNNSKMIEKSTVLCIEN